MSDHAFDFARLFAPGTPAPIAPFAGFPPYMFVGGNNDPQQVPIEGLVEAAATVLRRDGAMLAVYNMGQGPLGYPPLRDFVAGKVSRDRGIPATREQVAITSGSNQAIEMVARLFVSAGDTVLVEAFSYQGALGVFRRAGANLVGMTLDADGIVVEALAGQLARMKAQGALPKLIYTIPTIQNPTASILPIERRHALVALARQYGVAILEDECYADLLWRGVEAPQALRGIDPACVIHIGSFSKCLAPALRLGYIVADDAVLRQLMAVKNDIGTGALDQMIVAEFFTHHFRAHVDHLNGVLHEKLRTMVDAVEREFGTAAECWKPKGGIFLWIKLADGIDVRALTAPALAAGIQFNAGPDWAVDSDCSKSHLRLCFAMPDLQTIRDGVAALARVCFETTGIPRQSGNLRNRAA